MSLRTLLLLVMLVAAALGAWWFSTLIESAKDGHPVISSLKQTVKDSPLNNTNTHFEIAGDVVNAGTAGSYRLLFNGDGRFALTMNAQISQDTGFDGTFGWRRGWGKMPHELELDELIWERLIAGVQTGQWLREGSPFVVTAKTTEAPELLFAITHPNSDSFGADLVVDANSGLPIRLEQLSGRGHEVVSLGDYQEFSGVLIPATVTLSTSGLERIRYEVNSLDTVSSANYAIPKEIPDDVRFDPSIDPTVTIERAATGHLLVEPIVNGQSLGWFVFDSGAAVSAISKEAAAKLGLPLIGATPLVSIFGAVQAPVYRVDTLQLGPATVARPLFLEMDLAPLAAAFGVEVQGIFGYDFLARTVVEVAVAANTLRVFNPAEYSLPSGRWSELFLESQHPIVKGSLTPHSDLLFRLDLGSQLGLVIHTPWVDKLKLLEGVDYTATQLGPTFSGTIQEIPRFEFAGQSFENLSTVYILDDVPPLNDRGTTGNIGLQLLSNLKVVFDYMHKRIAFVEVQDN